MPALTAKIFWFNKGADKDILGCNSNFWLLYISEGLAKHLWQRTKGVSCFSATTQDMLISWRVASINGHSLLSLPTLVWRWWMRWWSINIKGEAVSFKNAAMQTKWYLIGYAIAFSVNHTFRYFNIYTVNPRFSHRWLIVNFEFWHGGLFEGRGRIKKFDSLHGA